MTEQFKKKKKKNQEKSVILSIGCNFGLMLTTCMFSALNSLYYFDDCMIHAGYSDTLDRVEHLEPGQPTKPPRLK